MLLFTREGEKEKVVFSLGEHGGGPLSVPAADMLHGQNRHDIIIAIIIIIIIIIVFCMDTQLESVFVSESPTDYGVHSVNRVGHL